MKKIVAVFCFLGTALLCTTLQANLPQDVWKSDWVNNWLLGISGGYANREGVQQVALRYGEAPIGFASTSFTREYSDTGIVFRLLGGYQSACEDWLLGVELNLDLQDIGEDHPFAFSDSQGLIGWNATSLYESNVLGGVTGRIGYAITYYFMIYARLGVELGRDEFQTTFSGNPEVYPFSVMIHDKRWVYRFLSGIGAEVPVVCAPFTLRLEYNFHSKGKTVETNGSIIDGVFNPLFNSNLQPKTQSMSVALVWNFF